MGIEQWSSYNSMDFFVKEQASSWFKKLVITKRFFKVGKSSIKNYILTAQNKQIPRISNNTKRSIEMTP